ncbi:MAG: MarR family transcriptional regulator [Clostridiales bacterium]|nr:MarR family transcriptional regulator [Clostridiales bacterium]
MKPRETAKQNARAAGEGHLDFTTLAAGFSRIERRHARYMNRALAAQGVTGINYSYIFVIHKNPGINQDNLADIHSVDKSRVARMIRRFELEGYVTREQQPEDRRHYMIRLTPKGEALHELIVQISKEWASLISGGIDEEDIAAMTRTIDRIIQNLDDK